MMDMVGINPLFASAIHLVMAQRLIRRLDDATKQAYEPDEALKAQIKLVIDSLPPGETKPDLNGIKLYKPGTSAANPFGFSGQLAIREQFRMTPGVQAMLKLPVNQITTESLQNQAVADGMRTMLQDGVIKAIAGLTTLEEVYRVAG
jgi:type IV pilus assembly protein PilB